MNFDIFISPSTLLCCFIIIIILIVGIIFFGKYYYEKISKERLAVKNTQVKYASPIIGRNKYPEVDPFRSSGYYLKASFLFALGTVLLAINYTTYEEEVIIPEEALTIEEEFEIEPPRTAEPPPLPPPPPPPVIEEVPNEEFLEEEDIEFLDQSIDEKTEVAYVPPPTPVKKEVAPPPPPPPPPPEEEFVEIFRIVEEMPRFPGCESIKEKEIKKQCADKKMLEFIYKNIRYPGPARENGIEGTAVIQFVIDTKGKIRKAQIVRNIGGGCGEEALRVVNLMNKEAGDWIPGQQRGKKVNVQFMLPVKFKLER